MAELGSSPGEGDDVTALCAELIRFDTTNRGHGDAEGEREAAEFVAGVLSGAGLEPKIVEPAPRRASVLARMVEAFLTRTGEALGVEVDLPDVDATLARLGPAASLAENTVRVSTTPTMLQAGYQSDQK